jgi:uncharacterized protein YyaL (SSP411 family)
VGREVLEERGDAAHARLPAVHGVDRRRRRRERGENAHERAVFEIARDDEHRQEGDVTKNETWFKQAAAIAEFMIADLTDEEGGGLFGSTKDPDAVGVFAARRIPFEDNVMALRMFAKLARGSTSPKYRMTIDRVLRAISVPEEIRARGRMLGDYLLALEETKGLRGAAPQGAGVSR